MAPNREGVLLQADEQSDSIADTFIFEMDAGYCEYFATAMTTMLRSQDIPARYVVGYSTGQPVGENSYEVRGMNAHAWVEVYFPDVGWVKFDPTPGGSRLDAQSDTLESELDENVDLEEPGSPGETFEPGNVNQESDSESDDEDDESDGAFDISLNRTAVPGLPVEVTVTSDEDPVADLAVSINGERIGTTDDDGTLGFVVPDVDELRISVEPLMIVEPGDGGNLTSFSTTPSGDSRLFSADAGGLTATQNTTIGDGNETRSVQVATNTTVNVERDATLSVAGDIRPGQNVTVSVTVGGVAIPDATVAVDGESVGTTDASGRTTLSLPAEPGNATLTAERGPVSGATTVTIPGLDIAVSTGSVPLPFGPATATVTAGDDPVAGAPIVVDGEQVATTGADGTAKVRLPLSPSATVSVSRDGLTDSETVDGLLRNAALVGGGLGIGLVVPGVVLYRQNLSVRGLLGTVTGAARRGVTKIPLALLWVVRHGTDVVAAALARLEATARYLFDAVRGRVSVGELTGAFSAWLRTTLDRTGAAGSSTDTAVDVTGDIQRAWAEFLTRLSVDDPGAHTPRELAAHAVEVDGHSPEAVQALLTAFRAVEYGSRPPKSYLDSAEDALARLDGPSPEEVSADGGQKTTQSDGTHTGQSPGDGGAE
ncbi:DUF4129 domain-containing transglutaminase family protein [Halovenus salina]|uniref:Transglutaminase domain-containing protein n=1 Tax=Halovenus salina TaxID=1510225 RepID=A0ABD5W089_9EURY